MNQEETATAITELLGHTLNNDAEAAWNKLIDIGTSVDGNRMYGVCCGIAAAGESALKKMFAPAAFAGPSGYLFGIQQLRTGTDPADMWAARFVVAFANRDSANTLALFETALKASTEEYVGSVAALVTTVTGLIVAATSGPGE